MLFSSPRMIIRRALPREAPALSALALRAKRHWGYAEAQLEAWRADLELTPEQVRAHPTYVGELDEHVIGFYSLEPSKPDSPMWDLENLWLEPEHQLHGYGRELLAHALRTAADGGATVMHIDADPNAESFYLACGAIRTGTVPAPIPGQPNRVRPQLMFSWNVE